MANTNQIPWNILFNFKERDRTWSWLGGEVGENLTKLRKEVKYYRNKLNKILKEKIFIKKIGQDLRARLKR